MTGRARIPPNTRAWRGSDAPARHPVRDRRIESSLLRILTSSAWRKGSLHEMDMAGLAPSLLGSITSRVKLDLPVRLTLMAFPFKVPNPAKTGARTLPDLAELAAIRRLLALADAVRTVYPPGLIVELIHDGAFIADVFGVSLAEVEEYERAFSALSASLGADNVIRPHDFGELQRRAGLAASEEMMADLEATARTWWQTERNTPAWRDCYRKSLGMLNTRGLDVREAGAQLEARVHAAMIGYRVKDALIHQLDPRARLFPDAIHSTTRAQPGRLALWLVRRGDALLPWHGVGTLTLNGQVRVMRAIDAASRPDLRPRFLPGESTPFCYAPEDVPLDLPPAVNG